MHFLNKGFQLAQGEEGGWGEGGLQRGKKLFTLQVKQFVKMKIHK